MDNEKIFRSISVAPPSTWPMSNFIKLVEHEDVSLIPLVELIRKRKSHYLTNK